MRNTQKMQTQDAMVILTNTIKNKLRHKDYGRVTELADEYRMYITGNGIDKKLKRFNPREDEEMFKQRLALTIPITQAVCSSLMKPFNKVARTKPIIDKVFGASKNTNKQVEEVNDRIKKFYGSETADTGLDYFLKNRFYELSFWDPNAWIVIEFDPFDSNKEKAKPRPFEVPSSAAINYSVKNNSPEWLIIKLDLKKTSPKDSNKVVDIEKYTIYTDIDAIVATELMEDDPLISENPNGTFITIEKKQYLIDVADHKAGKVPAFRVGYKRDLETEGRTFVSPLHDATCHLHKIIKQGSEFDLSTCLHTFPQKVVRLSAGTGIRNTRRLPDGSFPEVDKPIHTSAQDVIEVEMPDTKEEYVPLSDFIYYVPLPTDLLKFQKQLLDDLEVKCNQAVFNSTVMVKKTSTSDAGGDAPAATATEKDQDMDSVYDTIHPFADKLSSAWSQVVEFICIFTDNIKKVKWVRRYPSNFKMKTKEMLYSEMSTANDGNLPSFVKEAITDELAELVFVDEPKGLIRYRIQKQHYPFNGKSETEIQIAINSPLILKETKVLYNYFDQIFDELEQEFSNESTLDFYIDTTREKRKELIDAKVKEIIALLETQQPKAITYPTGD